MVSAIAPASPQVGQLWWDSVGGQLYVWYNDGNSSQWVIAVNAAASLLPASTTVLGGVKVDGTTIQAAPDGTISTMVVPMGDNRIINGDMRIDQRNAARADSSSKLYGGSLASQCGSSRKLTWQRQTLSSPLPDGFHYALTFTSSSSYTLAAGDYFAVQQRIEAEWIGDFMWGTAQTQPVTLSFWAMSSLPGVFGGSVGNGSTRTYPFVYSIPSPGVWVKTIITIPGETTALWNLTGIGVGCIVGFGLGVGTTYSAPANAWANNNFLSANGATQRCFHQRSDLQRDRRQAGDRLRRHAVQPAVAGEVPDRLPAVLRQNIHPRTSSWDSFH